jgi:hypothetical protein
MGKRYYLCDKKEDAKYSGQNGATASKMEQNFY